MTDPLRDVLLPRLEQVRPVGAGYKALCPAHDDTDPSLSIDPGKTQPVVLKCRSAECAPADILAAVGLTWADVCAPQETQKPRIVAEYLYSDETGAPLYTVKRYEPGRDGNPKSFAQFRPDGRAGVKGVRRVLYRLPELLAAVRDGRRVWVVEGEKDADRLVRLGEIATCNSGGTGNPWRAEFAEWFRDADVTVIADNDASGLQHAERVRALLAPVAKSLTVVRAAVDHNKADVSDHLAAGHGLDELVPVTTDEAEPQGAAPANRRVRSQPLTEIVRRRRQYLWKQRLPLGEVTLWVGHAGIGKSQAAVWLAARVTRGELEGELHGVPTPVLYLGTEDSWEYTLAPRFDAADADPSKVFRLYVENEFGDEDVVSLAVDLDALREEIEATGARLVVLDALLSTFGSAKLTEQNTVRRYLEPLARLAQELGIAVVGVAHFRKASDSNPLHMISGSSEFGQVVRSAIGFAPDREAEDGSCILSLIKTNLATSALPSLRYRVEPAIVDTGEGPTDVGKFVLLGETDQNIEDVLNREHSSAEDRSERDEAAEWLLGFLKAQKSGWEAPRAEVMKAARKEGFSDATIKRAKTLAKVRHASGGFPRTTQWIHPEFTTESENTVGSPRSEPTGDEPTAPTDATSGNTSTPVQSAQTYIPEPTADEGVAEGNCFGCGWPVTSQAHEARCGDAA